MRKIILIGIVLLLVGCKPNPLLLSKCEELKELTMDNMISIKELNDDFGYNMSYEIEIKGYNQLCGGVTGFILEISKPPLELTHSNESMISIVESNRSFDIIVVEDNNNTEIMKITGKGEFYLNDILIDNHTEIGKAFRWLLFNWTSYAKCNNFSHY